MKGFFRPKIGLFVSWLLLVTLACSLAATPSAPEPTPSPTVTPVPDARETQQSGDTEGESGSGNLALRVPDGPPPRVDTDISTVPIEEVVFDTFQGGFVRLSDASDATIDALRDRIRPIYSPIYDAAEGGDWMREGELVIGYVGEESGQAFAYPIRMLNLHEIVNDVIDGVPVLISYCPLCASGVVYSRELDGEVLLFGNTSALYESDLVMYDHETGSYWFQVLGEAIVGPLSGNRLTLLPSVTIEWGQWKELHPDTRVLSRDMGLLPSRAYSRDPFAGYQEVVNGGRFVFPVSEDKLDDRLRPGDKVFAVQVGETHKAYLLTGSPDSVINDEVEGQRVVVILREDGPTGAAYLSNSNGRDLSFRLNGDAVEDAETGSRWDDGGRAVSGPLAGTRLTPVPSRTSFWFSLVGSLPGIELHKTNS